MTVICTGRIGSRTVTHRHLRHHPVTNVSGIGPGQPKLSGAVFADAKRGRTAMVLGRDQVVRGCRLRGASRARRFHEKPNIRWASRLGRAGNYPPPGHDPRRARVWATGGRAPPAAPWITYLPLVALVALEASAADVVSVVVVVLDEAIAEVSVAAGAVVSTGAASVDSVEVEVSSLALLLQAASPRTSAVAAIPVTSLRIVTPL